MKHHQCVHRTRGSISLKQQQQPYLSLIQQTEFSQRRRVYCSATFQCTIPEQDDMEITLWICMREESGSRRSFHVFLQENILEILTVVPSKAHIYCVCVCVCLCVWAGVDQSVLFLATDWTPEFDPRQRQRVIPLASAHRPALRPMQTPIQWVQGSFPGGKAQPGRRAGQSECLIMALMMETVNTSEVSVSMYETTRRNVPEGCHLQDRLYRTLDGCLTLLHGIRQVPGSNLGTDTGYSDLGSSWFSSVPPGANAVIIS
jgi:hypothetical protein